MARSVQKIASFAFAADNTAKLSVKTKSVLMIKSKITALFCKLRAESFSSEYFDICSMKRVKMSRDLNQEFLKPALFTLLTGQ